MEGAGFSICIKAGALRLPPFMNIERQGFPERERLECCVRVRHIAIVEHLNPEPVGTQYV